MFCLIGETARSVSVPFKVIQKIFINSFRQFLFCMPEDTFGIATVSMVLFRNLIGDLIVITNNNGFTKILPNMVMVVAKAER